MCTPHAGRKPPNTNVHMPGTHAGIIQSIIIFKYNIWCTVNLCEFPLTAQMHTHTQGQLEPKETTVSPLTCKNTGIIAKCFAVPLHMPSPIIIYGDSVRCSCARPRSTELPSCEARSPIHPYSTDSSTNIHTHTLTQKSHHAPAHQHRIHASAKLLIFQRT